MFVDEFVCGREAESDEFSHVRLAIRVARVDDGDREKSVGLSDRYVRILVFGCRNESRRLDLQCYRN